MKKWIRAMLLSLLGYILMEAGRSFNREVKGKGKTRVDLSPLYLAGILLVLMAAGVVLLELWPLIALGGLAWYLYKSRKKIPDTGRKGEDGSIDMEYDERTGTWKRS
ncbi:hypothetical protein [Thermosediminibacter oceani]|uniref:Uncharacterized protein n=1 Tax=Thermosediminibacter oceani (strain ATCC BAA-1034 / DSM 16646 / JW/IW-1228P) TaxID=555079 RepID=D9RZI8_THEOJ|nr:hypothetical protein [Thermosediminibacter oceani]ADL06886.1 hypothetical protein Toce_0094 [Thermosediminibacter oceani DSM 16646]